MKTIQYLFLSGIAFGVGATVAASCVPVYRTISFRCNPRGPVPQCPENQTCCSDDAQAEGGGLPDFRTFQNPQPIFAGPSNGRSARGMCIRLDDLAPGQGLPGLNCPVPCNPAWDPGDIQQVCGNGRVCCQTVELGHDDCQFYGNGDYKPVSGEFLLQQLDAQPDGTDPRVIWTPGAFDTHQDPGLDGCIGFSGGLAALSTPTGRDIFNDCIANLTAADKRGFCMSAAEAFCYQFNPGYESGQSQCQNRFGAP